MTPTPKLRFVWRDVEMVKDTRPLRVRVLQQWFAYDIDYPTEKGEWRDVPTEQE